MQQAPFVVTTYRPNADGLMTADWPDRCPLSAPGQGPCRLTRHMFRRRKTGPQIPLDVLRCRTHERHLLEPQKLWETAARNQ